MDEARSLATYAARSNSTDGVMPLMMDMAQLLVMDHDWSLSMDEEKINNQPNLLMDNYDTMKPHSGPTNF